MPGNPDPPCCHLPGIVTPCRIQSLISEKALHHNNIRAQTSYSPQYVEKHGAESFLCPDAAQSIIYSSGTNSLTGDGYTNTSAFSSSFETSAAAGGASIVNDGFGKRLLYNPPNAGTDLFSSWPSLGSAAASTTIANQTARGAFVAGAGTSKAIMGTWNYMLKIKLVDLHPIFKELDLMANPRIRLRFRVNQGVSSVAVDATKSISLAYTTLSSGNRCLVMVAASSTSNSMAGVLAASAPFSIAWGAVVTSLEPTIDGTYMPFTTSRLYKVRFNDCYAELFYQCACIGKQSTQLNASFDLQISASVKNTKYVIVLPFADQTNSLNSAAVSKISAIYCGLTPELVNGLLDYQTWSLTNRVLIADVGRLSERDVPQSIQIQRVNADCQGINMIFHVISEQELSYDRLTGEVLEFTTAYLYLIIHLI
ncbi:uncharacterized protein PITG_21560 [Phytophthora infestans T30-4]|uniref:Uncharacterized protein n=1 Tax=Phytophthora infestans (strain T30-4) TaxID=403677 RepID=D0P442_PHYIT|nr:uncharacterized protein PITG_21560 [Phytophthora infestans T30-4]EEY62922.1 conserved hypothetical protein [Phytophthora infestans T30-4]|eukprot:XP_002894933.1 conserved hypothetical protein [Phytophthora infestans T30-4]